MRTYRDKEDLKNEIRQSFEKYISEFDTVPEALKDKKYPAWTGHRQRILRIRRGGQHRS